MEFNFTFKYQLAEEDDPAALVERLGAAGCDDALVGTGQTGRLALEFTREALSAEEALVTALADVKRAIPTAKLIEAAPDFVGLTDVADMIGVTRQNMRKLWVSHSTSFPMPVHEGVSTVWHLADVLAWLAPRGAYQWSPGVFEVAITTKQINLARQLRQRGPRLRREVRALVS
jgi:predicted DNA-binding transcriptional regulator AlpA